MNAMARYFLTRLRVEGFRGINNEANPLDLRFSPTAVNSVFAVNAIGKSSAVVAVLAYFFLFCFLARGLSCGSQCSGASGA